MILSALLDAGLLSASEHSSLSLPNLLLFESRLAKTALVERIPASNALPPASSNIPLSRWLSLTIGHLFKMKDFRGAGDYLWNVQGFLPGGFSSSWTQILLVLSPAPSDAFREPRIWTLASIAREVFDKCRRADFERDGANEWITKNSLRAPLPLAPDGEDARIFGELAAKYLDGLNEFLDWRGGASAGIEDFFWEMGDMRIQSGRPGNGRNSLSLSLAYRPLDYAQIDWTYRQMVSAARLFDPKAPIETGSFYLGGGMKPLEEFFVQEFLPKSFDSPSAGVLYAEPLVEWKSPRVAKYLESYRGLTFLFNNKAYIQDYKLQNRITILKNAVRGVPGYQEWV